MTVAASTILTRVRAQLIDTGEVQRWTDAELLRWLSDGQRTIVAITPQASSINVTVPLVAGTKQSVPSDGHMLLTILKNATGRAMRIVSREVMDAQDPSWHSKLPKKIALNYIYEPAQPKTFYVSPPNDGTGSVEMIYSVLPEDLTSLTSVISVQEIYQTALFDYVMFRANQKDSDWPAGQGVAQLYLQAFQTFMGQGEGGQVAANPNLQLAAPDLTNRGSAK